MVVPHGWALPSLTRRLRGANAYPPHPLTLLRPRRERPGGRRAAEQRDELAPSHVGHGDSSPAAASLTQNDVRFLGADLVCSGSRSSRRSLRRLLEAARNRLWEFLWLPNCAPEVLIHAWWHGFVVLINNVFAYHLRIQEAVTANAAMPLVAGEDVRTPLGAFRVVFGIGHFNNQPRASAWQLNACPIHSSPTPADSQLLAQKIVASGTRRGYAGNGQLTVFSTVL